MIVETSDRRPVAMWTMLSVYEGIGLGTERKPKGAYVMKCFLATVAILVMVAASAFAEGGKEHGEKGKGETHQTVGP